MKKKNNIVLPAGRYFEIAEYKQQLLDDYDGNPLIEALPHIMSKTDVVKAITNYPRFDEKDIEHPAHLRSHCVLRLTQYFQPTSRHIDLEQRISKVLRQGYLARNPLLPEYKMRLREISKSFKDNLRNEQNELLIRIKGAKATVSGFTMIGVSGVGKTTALNNILELYPQIILHSNYKGTPLNFYQIVYLKLDCPHAGSLKGLCIDFFKGIDNILGTNYYDKYGSTRNSEDSMLSQMAQIAYIHSLGLLVIDEIQNLSEAKSGGKGGCQKFCVNWFNSAS